MLLNKKISIVTGAGGRGIGKGIALRLAEEGANVVINYAHSAVGAEEMAKKIRALGREAFTFKADVSKANQVQAMVDKTVEIFGRVDILVNNAGIDPYIPFLEMKEEQWDLIIDTNLKGNFLCSQAVAREMVKTGGGKIIIIGSLHSILNMKGGYTAYASAKGGLNAMTRQLALELAPYKINVNCIAPGAIHVEKFYESIPGYDPTMLDHEIPVGFIGMPEDIAAAAVFFASDGAKYITGQVLFVDGGTSAIMALGITKKGD